MYDRNQKVEITLLELSHLVGSVNAVGVFSPPVGLALDALHAAADDLHAVAIAAGEREGDAAVPNCLAGIANRLATVEDIVERLARASGDPDAETLAAAEHDLDVLKSAAAAQGGAP